MGDIIGRNDREILLPSHVLQDPLFDHSNKHQLHNSFINHNHGSGGFRRPGAPPSDSFRETFPWNYNTLQTQQNNWQMSKREDQMQAFFLVPPGRKASGTGVFLPASACHLPTKKTASTTVLLPVRVVQALNRSVHNKRIHISPRSEMAENDSKKKSEMVETPVNTEGETLIDSPEKLLPEEWIY
ncbi:uncharacterized protein LOC130509071 isoform X1 [Raphanus sativus]|uniref:Uncharacterized protein LOC108846153 isoform X1 n=1 Tax=Raphanus sativus TaxID=3726 RepID=A0A6J0MQZ6_RAPSA|nr:uncharacterized protein LOC108846153 isoform X1 [Raphanus sativus]XP_056860613.1 uncharacterized protein LOC130509071 isoform X1 [Raphanus sativus]